MTSTRKTELISVKSARRMAFERHFQPRISLGLFSTILMLSLPALAATVAQSRPAPPEGGIITSQAIVLDPGTRNAFVVDTQRDSVAVIHLANHTVDRVQVGKDPIALALNAATHRVYVVNHGSGTVSVLNSESAKEIATVAVDKLPYSIAVDQKTNEIFVSSVYSNELKIIDGVTNAVTSVHAISADAMTVNAGAGVLYMLGYESSELTLFDITHRTLSKLPIGVPHLWAIARNPATSVAYITRIGTADMVAYNEASHTSSIVKTGNYPCALAINTRTNMVYVVNYADQIVSVINGADHGILATLPAGDHPQAIAINEATNEAYVANVHGDSVTVIDGSKQIVANTVPAGKNPYGMVVDDATGTVITANEGEPSFTVLEQSSLHRKLQKPAVR